MQTLRLTIKLRSAFGTLPKGDTLFGQLCWVIRNRCSEARLEELLQGYTSGRPFAVISDAFPAGYLPRPVLPGHLFEAPSDLDRKAAKKRVWLPLTAFDRPVAAWLRHCQSPQALPHGAVQSRLQPHNSINRATYTTGNGFDPYSMEQLWYGRPVAEEEGRDKAGAHLDIYVVLDETRLAGNELHGLFTDMGTLGFGRDASIGLGKFDMESGADTTAFPFLAQNKANAWLTLAPCAPQGLSWNESRCFYQPFTRFGRHGDVGVHLGNPFKTPLLLADTGAVLTPRHFEQRLFAGQGLGGDGDLSKAIPETVHQGYAPVVGIVLPGMDEREVA